MVASSDEEDFLDKIGCSWRRGGRKQMLLKHALVKWNGIENWRKEAFFMWRSLTDWPCPHIDFRSRPCMNTLGIECKFKSLLSDLSYNLNSYTFLSTILYKRSRVAFYPIYTVHALCTWHVPIGNRNSPFTLICYVCIKAGSRFLSAVQEKNL